MFVRRRRALSVLMLACACGVTTAGCDGDARAPVATDAVFLPDGRIVVAGLRSDGEEIRAWATGFAGIGEERWQTLGERSTHPPALAVLPSGRLVLATTGSLLALEPDGTPAWERRPVSEVPTPAPESLEDVASAGDGHLLVVGARIALVPHEDDPDVTVPAVQPYVMRVAGDGSVPWLRVLPDLGALLQVVAADADAGAVAAGVALERPALRLVALDAGGGLRWAREASVHGGALSVHDVIALEDGGVAVALWVGDEGDGPGDAAVLRLDETGAFDWYRRWEGPGDEVAWRLAERPGGGLWVAATTTANATGGPDDADLWLVELDPAGETERQVLVSSLDADLPLAVRAPEDGTVEVVGQRGPDVERWVLGRDGALLEGCGVRSETSFPTRPMTNAVVTLDVTVETVTRDTPPSDEPDVRRASPLPVPVCRE